MADLVVPSDLMAAAVRRRIGQIEDVRRELYWALQEPEISPELRAAYTDRLNRLQKVDPRGGPRQPSQADPVRSGFDIEDYAQTHGDEGYKPPTHLKARKVGRAITDEIYGGPVGAAVRSFNNAVTLGAWPRLVAALGGTPVEEDRAIREAHPRASAIGAVGSAAVPVGPMNMIGRSAGAVTQRLGPTIDALITGIRGGRTAAATARGALTGAQAGAASEGALALADDANLKQAGERAVRGAGYGAAFGGAAGGAADASARGVARIREKFEDIPLVEEYGGRIGPGGATGLPPGIKGGAANRGRLSKEVADTVSRDLEARAQQLSDQLDADIARVAQGPEGVTGVPTKHRIAEVDAMLGEPLPKSVKGRLQELRDELASLTFSDQGPNAGTARTVTPVSRQTPAGKKRHVVTSGGVETVQGGDRSNLPMTLEGSSRVPLPKITDVYTKMGETVQKSARGGLQEPSLVFSTARTVTPVSRQTPAGKKRHVVTSGGVETVQGGDRSNLPMTLEGSSRVPLPKIAERGPKGATVEPSAVLIEEGFPWWRGSKTGPLQGPHRISEDPLVVEFPKQPGQPLMRLNAIRDLGDYYAGVEEAAGPLSKNQMAIKNLADSLREDFRMAGPEAGAANLRYSKGMEPIERARRLAGIGQDLSPEDAAEVAAMRLPATGNTSFALRLARQGQDTATAGMDAPGLEALRGNYPTDLPVGALMDRPRLALAVERLSLGPKDIPFGMGKGQRVMAGLGEPLVARGLYPFLRLMSGLPPAPIGIAGSQAGEKKREKDIRKEARR